jgi:hypothetical protein
MKTSPGVRSSVRIASMIFSTAMAVSVAPASAMTFPIFGDYSLEASDGEEFTANFDFRGIVALSNCSGSIVRFDDSKVTDRAMVLSNGHCVGMLKPGVVLANNASRLSFTVLGQDTKQLGTISAERLLYATMTDTDVSLFLLKETFQEIETKFSVKPLTLSRQSPAVGTNIQVLSGYWKRGFACSVEKDVPLLKEADWTFVDSLRYSRPGCEIIGGTSGSPVLEAGTRNVVAVNNTVNESGKVCQMNNPCEVGEDGSRFAQKGYGYAQQIFWFYSCRNGAGQIDLNISGCRLPK